MFVLIRNQSYASDDLQRLRTKSHQLTLYSNVICCLLGVGFLCFVVIVIAIDLRTLMRIRKHFVVAIHPRSSEFFVVEEKQNFLFKIT